MRAIRDRASPLIRRVACCALLLGGCAAPAAAAAAPSAQTVCVLDFNRLGEDAEMDWLRRGLSDMMITALNGLSGYQVVERERLSELLKEHDLALTGIVDPPAALRRARLAKAELLLLGNFVKRGPRVTIEIRLLRVVDQGVLATARWDGDGSAVLKAPTYLTQALLENLSQPFDPARLRGLEREIPQTIDVARAFYLGVGAFEDGHYAESLARHLEAASAGPFLRNDRAAIKMYYLLGQSDHAVAHAQDAALRLERAGRFAEAMEFYEAAAAKCHDPLGNDALGAVLLERALRLARRIDPQSSEYSKTRDALIDDTSRLDEPGANGVHRRHYRSYRLERRAFTWGLSDEPKLSEKASYFSEPLGRWLYEPYPYPSVLMWEIRIRRELARMLARSGQAEKALAQYRDLYDRLDFLTRLPIEGFDRMTEPLATEAHFVLLRHYRSTGRLIRDHPFADINPLNVVAKGQVFSRSHPDRDIDPRARRASRYPDRGYEFFDFASPEGFEIRSVTLTARVRGLAAFSFYLPDPKGWPPQFSFSKRLRKLKYWRAGTYRTRIKLPPGTELVSLGTAWGRGMFENQAWEIKLHDLFGPDDNQEIESWQVAFELAPESGRIARPRPPADDGDRRLARSLAGRQGWSDPIMLRDARSTPYDGRPRIDVFTREWLAFSLDGDIRIHRRDDPRMTVRLPRTVNTSEREFDPSLVRTHDGGYALLWSRGSDKRSAVQFIARSRDLLEWQTPQRMLFAPAADTIGYHYRSAEPLRRSYNVRRVAGGYVMLLAQGFVRFSKDLRSWDAPRRALPQDLLENRLIRTHDGRLWAAYECSSDELRPYDEESPLTGYFVTDGQRYRHVCEIRLAWSRDGRHWQETGRQTFDGQASNLWLFPLSSDQVVLAVQFNNLYMRWLVSPGGRSLVEAPSVVQLMSDSQAEIYAEGSRIACVRPVFDHVTTQRQVLLKMSSRAQYERLVQ